MDSLDALLSRLFTLHRKTIELSLGRIERLLAALGSPETGLPPIIHVAGTNGKGSTIAFMRAILEAAGKRVHVYTSPHLVRFHERIRLGAKGSGKLVGDAELFGALTACEKANDNQPITFFEITTAAAFKLFSEHPADYLLLEVGLGGRFDATNVIKRPRATVITPVSIDHPEFLGATVDKIAYEKAGILKPGALAIASSQEEAALAVIEREARRLGVPLIAGGRDYNIWEEHGRLVFEDKRGLLDLPLPRLTRPSSASKRCDGDRRLARDRAASCGVSHRRGVGTRGVARPLAKSRQGPCGVAHPGRLRDLARWRS